MLPHRPMVITADKLTAEPPPAPAPARTRPQRSRITLDRVDRESLIAYLAGSRGPRHARAVALCGGDRARARHLIAVYDDLAARRVPELPILGVRLGRVLNPTRLTATRVTP